MKTLFYCACRYAFCSLVFLFLPWERATAESFVVNLCPVLFANTVSFHQLLETQQESPHLLDPHSYDRISTQVLSYYRRHSGRTLLVFTDSSWDQMSGVVIVKKILRSEVERLTGLKVEFITPEFFPFHFNSGVQDIRVALARKKKFLQILRERNPIAVHLMVEGSVGLMARRVLNSLKIPYTSAFHTDFPNYAKDWVRGERLKNWVRDRGYAYLRYFHKNSQRVMVPTPSMAKILEENGFDSRRVARWSHGVDVEMFHPQFRNLDIFAQMVGRSLPRPISLYVGRIEPEKNLEDFLKMNIPGTKVLIGSGSSLNDLKQKYPEAIFLGRKPHQDVPKFFASADIFIFTSLTDTFGLVTLEAAASGTPVLAYNVRGPKDVLVDTRMGELVEHTNNSAQNINHLESAFYRVLNIRRQDTREAALQFPWDRSIIEFLYFLSPIEPN